MEEGSLNMNFSEAVKNIFNDINTTLISEYATFGKPKEESRKRLPSSLSLDGKYIAEIDFDDEVFQITENIRSIHLNNNSIRSWQDVVILLQNIPGLESLNLSSNPLALYHDLDLPKDSLFPNLKVLILNDTQARWEIVLPLLKHLPSLEALHLSLNKQTLADTAMSVSGAGQYANLKQLFYSSNDCHELTELILIGDMFPSLENLVLMNNSLVSLIPSNVEDDSLYLHNHFLNLASLSISNNLINDWSSIDYLTSFEKLTELRVASQPLFESLDKEFVWNELVSRLHNIDKLNGSIIDEEVRSKAQRAFMRYYLDKEEKPPKFEDLRRIHGDIAPLVDIDLTPENLFPIKVICGDEHIEVPVDVRCTVGELKKNWCGQFGIENTSDYNLLYWDSDAVEVYGPERMTFPNRKLFAYKISKNDWFSLDHKYS